MKCFDILIIGNGILGLSTAYALSLENHGLNIAIVGPSHRKGCASLAAGAMLGAFSETSEATFASIHGRAKLDMAVQAARMWPDWVKGINDQINDDSNIGINLGTFVTLNTESSKREDKNFGAIKKALDLYGESYFEVDPCEIPGLNPAHNCRPLRALFIPREGYLNPFSLFKALENILKRQKNITFIDSCVNKIRTTSSQNKIIEVHEDNLLEANQVVIAAGAYTQHIIDQLPELKSKIPLILAGSGTSFLLEYPDHKFQGVIRSPNRAGACGIHIMPRTENQLFIGSSNSLGILPKTYPKTRDIYYSTRRAMEQLHQGFNKGEIIEWFVGNRPTPVDTFPLLGETSIKGLWMLTGTYRDGFHDSPLLARSLARQILGHSSLFSHPFHPERTPIQTMTLEESMHDFVEQHVAVGYEHAIQLPKIGFHEVLEEMLYKKAEDIYKKLEINFGIPFDLLIALELNRELIPFFRDYYKSLKMELEVNI